MSETNTALGNLEDDVSISTVAQWLTALETELREIATQL